MVFSKFRNIFFFMPCGTGPQFNRQLYLLLLLELGIFLFQKKDANIKTIPAFRPIPSDNATPDSTPEKPQAVSLQSTLINPFRPMDYKNLS